jgi:tetratricopeptide (TPR) repeat protein
MGVGLAPISTGSVLKERYRLDGELGRGGMGIVFRAHDLLLDRPVAVKLLTTAAVGSSGRARWLHEAQAVAKLNHPNIIIVYDAGANNGFSFIVMELLAGESLYEKRPAALDEIMSIASQICLALEHAHRHGIIHRDLKLENVIVEPDGRVVLTDFGLARSQASRITMEGAIVGTVYYLAPEQALGQPIDGRTDLYALGVMLYELICRRLPFTGNDPLAVISQHLHAPVVPPSTYHPRLPAALDALVLRLLSKRPEDRPASASEVLKTLEDLRTGTPLVLEPLSEFSPLARLAHGRLFGREHELAEVKALWRQVITAPGDRHVILIHGEPGVGKTPFMREVVALAEISGGRVLAGECFAEGGSPYAPIAQVIRSVLAAPRATTEAIQVIPSGGAAASPQGASTRPLLETDLPLPLLADLLTLAPELRATLPHIQSLPAIDPQTEQLRLFESVVNLFAMLADRSPLLLVIEDVHYADGGTLYLLRHLARRCRALKLRLLIVMTYRNGNIDSACCLDEVLLDFSQERLALRLKLNRLTQSQTADLLQYMFQGEVDPEFVATIYQVTEGNLFFVEEVCKSLIEEGRLFCADGQWNRSSMAEIQIPESIQATVQARVGKLSASTQDLLRLAAIIGREFDFDILQRASGLDEEALIEALEEAERAQIISESTRASASAGAAAEISFVFAHALIPTTLRESISGLRRRRLHRQVARAIEDLCSDEMRLEQLAYHFEQAGDADKARHYYSGAAERALVVYASQDAERHNRSALALATGPEERASLLGTLGEALFRQSRFLDARQAWLDAAALYQKLGDHNQLAHLYARAARAVWYDGEAPRCLEICLEGLAIVRGMTGSEAPVETPGLAALLHETARAYRFTNENEKALPLCQQALELAERLGLVEVQADALATLGILPNQPAEARRKALLRAVELAEGAGLLLTAARAHLNLSGYYMETGQLGLARQQAQLARSLAEQVGFVSWKHDFRGTEVAMALNAGDFQFAEQHIAVMRQLHTELSEPAGPALFTDFLEACLKRYHGEWDEAVQLFQACDSMAAQRGDQGLRYDILDNLAELQLEMGQAEEALLSLTEALAIVRENPALKVNLPRAYCLLGLAMIDQGRLTDARQALDQAQAALSEESDPYNLVMLAWARAHLAAADRQLSQAEGHFETAVAACARIGMPWYQAHLQQEWAEVIAASNQPPDRARAGALLAEARLLFEQMGLPRYVALVDIRLNSLLPTD